MLIHFQENFAQATDRQYFAHIIDIVYGGVFFAFDGFIKNYITPIAFKNGLIAVLVGLAIFNFLQPH